MVTMITEGLNDPQRRAVESIDGPLLIIAGPGSGKTRVITHRIGHLVRNAHISPHQILAVTFTNKAANEMKSRLDRLVGVGSKQLTVGTFHAFSASVLRRHGYNIGLNHDFSIFDDQDQMELIKTAMDQAYVDPKQYPRRAIQGAISRAKSMLLDPRNLSVRKSSYFEEVAAKVYLRYEELLSDNSAVDFDDLLLKTVYLFRNIPEVAKSYQERYIHIMIDEFQDTNVCQYDLAKILANRYRNICVVGDPDQSIYSWRNADIRNILRFQKDYPETTIINLEENYRSTSTILEAAKGVISTNRQRLVNDVWTSNGKGSLIEVHEAFTEVDEAQYVMQSIDRLLSSGSTKRIDCAVMYRVNAQSRSLEEACLKYGMKYKLVGGVRFYQRREIKDLIAYLRFINNPQDQLSLDRIINVPPRGLGKVSLSRLSIWANTQGITLYNALERLCDENPVDFPVPPRIVGSVSSFVSLMRKLWIERDRSDVVTLIDTLLDGLRYRGYLESKDDFQERWENVQELKSAAQEFSGLGPGGSLTGFLEHLALVADLDSYDNDADAITLITIHQAKGLEFPVVFITGMEEGLLPHYRSMDDPDELEEERRLCYVGMTRCKDRLFLTRAFKRGLMGLRGPTIPSRFLSEVPYELVHSLEPSDKQRDSDIARERVKIPSEPLTIFKLGDKVYHEVFGHGLIVSYSGVGADQEVTVAFTSGAGVKRLLVSYAPIVKLDH